MKTEEQLSTFATSVGVLHQWNWPYAQDVKRQPIAVRHVGASPGKKDINITA